MANDFSKDASCKALWRFENGALTTDSKGTNTLTPVNTPTANTSDYKEGAASTALVYASHQFYKIADAALDAGFPLKSGDTVKTATLCFFVKPASYASNTIPQTLIGYEGYHVGTLKFFVALAGTNSNNLILYWGYNSGANFYTYDTGIQLSKDAWWHIAVRIDGVNKVFNVRAWKYSDSTQKTYSASPGNVMSIMATEFRIGGTIQSDTAYSFDGLIDEFVVFNRLLSDAEIDKIRNQTYGFLVLTTSCAGVSATSTPLVTITRPLATSLGAQTATDTNVTLWAHWNSPGSYCQPNVPSNDPTCVARWRFESFDNIDDLIGGNQLLWLPSDGHPLNFQPYKEGFGSEYLDWSIPNAMYRADANLNANFPLKNGNSLIGNVSGWFHPNYTGTATLTLFSKSGGGNYSITVNLWYGYLQILWGNGGSTETWNGPSLTVNHWYHISINFDGPGKVAGIRVWDDTAQVLLYLNWTGFSNALAGDASDFMVGATGSHTSHTNHFLGYIDELIVWNRKLTIAEMELVQEQYFHGDIKVENNNFASDPSCQAVWDFEEGAVTTDGSGKGNNLVTDNLWPSNGLVGAGNGGKFGNAYGGITGAYIPDANLVNGFPFKSNDTKKQLTFCAWLAPYQNGTSQQFSGGVIFAKRGQAGHDGIEIIQDTASPYHLKVVWGDGTNLTTYDTGIVLSFWRAYHVSVEIDGINKTIHAEVFENYTGTLYTYDVAPSTQVVTSSHALGMADNGDGDNASFNGFIDQVVVWNRLLTSAELANVRAGTFAFIALSTTVAAQTQTASVLLSILYHLTSSVSGVTSAATPLLTVKRPLLTSPTAVSVVSSPILAVTRALQTAEAVQSQTSGPELLLLNLLITAINGQTQSPDVLLDVIRPLTTGVASEIQTSDSLLEVLRDLATTISGESSVSSPALQIFDFLVNAIQATTNTSSVSLPVLRKLLTTIAANVVIHDDAVLFQHAIYDLKTFIRAQTQTPDDVELLMPFFESLLAKAKRYYGPIIESE